MAITIFQHLEDFDNDELSLFDHHEQLRDAVFQYNYENGTEHDPELVIKQYKNVQRNAYYPEP